MVLAFWALAFVQLFGCNTKEGNEVVFLGEVLLVVTRRTMDALPACVGVAHFSGRTM